MYLAKKYNWYLSGLQHCHTTLLALLMSEKDTTARLNLLHPKSMPITIPPTQPPCSLLNSLQRLVVGACVTNPRVPCCSNGVRYHPDTSVSCRSSNLGASERHASLERAQEDESVQDDCLLDQSPLPPVEWQDVGLDSLVKCGSRGIKHLSRCGSSRKRLRGNRRVEQEFLGCNTSGKDLDEHGNRGFEVRGFESGDVEVRDQEDVQVVRLQACPEYDNVHSDGQQRVGNLHLDAVEQEAVAQRRVCLVRDGTRPQEVGWDCNSQDLDVHMRRNSQGRDLVVRREEVRVWRVGKQRERGDVIDCEKLATVHVTGFTRFLQS
jgi:hypothetical protein